jgi:LmbE family N-acetylglucosaminyl deacetylase
MFSKRILILIAHPDDEVVGCTAAIMRAKAQGAEIFALYLTHGCLPQETLWRWQRKDYAKLVATRRAEAERAAQMLGIIPLGWPVRPARQLWRELPHVLAEVEAAMAQCRPDQIWVPAYEGGNPDHDALNAVGFKLKNRMSVLEFAEYNFFEGRAQAQNFISPDPTVRVIDLTPEEAAAKRVALKIYASEKGNLSYVRFARESYRPLARYDYAQPPHKGRLWYMRFQWVPFKHPRVDFTDPAEVSKAILTFML